MTWGVYLLSVDNCVWRERECWQLHKQTVDILIECLTEWIKWILTTVSRNKFDVDNKWCNFIYVDICIHDNVTFDSYGVIRWTLTYLCCDELMLTSKYRAMWLLTDVESDNVSIARRIQWQCDCQQMYTVKMRMLTDVYSDNVNVNRCIQ